MINQNPIVKTLLNTIIISKNNTKLKDGYPNKASEIQMITKLIRLKITSSWRVGEQALSRLGKVSLFQCH